MDTFNVKESLDKIVDRIFKEGKSFYNEPLSPSIRRLVHVEGDATKGKILVPYWFSVVQYGRGPAKRGSKAGPGKLTDFGKAIYAWMDKRNMFTSKTAKGKINEAKGLAWYINKHGTKHYRNGKYIDIYDTIIKESVAMMRKDIRQTALKITSNLVKL